MGTTFINPEGMMKSAAFSQAVVTEGKGKTLYIGGQNAVDAKGELIGKGDIAAQSEQVMKNIGIALKACGAGFKDIIKMNIYLIQGQDARAAFEASQKVMDQSANPPIVTGLFVAGLAHPDYLVEAEAVAFVDDNA